MFDSSSAEGHRFWSASSEYIDELQVPEEFASLRTRVIEFTGDFQPVTHTCRVPLPSGRLCPRKDRVKVNDIKLEYFVFLIFYISLLRTRKNYKINYKWSYIKNELQK